MNNRSVTEVFFYGRAVAQVLKEKTEEALTNSLSELGKLDAELREQVRSFVEEVQLRAEQEAQAASATAPSTTTVRENVQNPADTQEMVDELRAEIARLRAELKAYQSNKAS